MLQKSSKIWKVAVAGLLALTIVACGTNGAKDANGTNNNSNSKAPNETTGGTGNTDNKPETQTPAEKPIEPTELVIYSESGWSQDEFNDRFGNSIRKKFPQHTFTYIQKLEANKGNGAGTLGELIAAGTKLDIYWDSVSKIVTNLKDMGLEYDMTELIKKQQLDLIRLEPSVVEFGRTMSEGKMYALPVVINTQAMYYNIDIFEKFGQPYLVDGMMWDDVLEVGRKLSRKDGDEEYWGIGLYVDQYLPLNPFSLPYVDPVSEKATIQNESWRPVYDVLTRIYQTTDNKMMSPNVFATKKNVAITVALGNFFLADSMTDMNWDIVSFPKYKEAPELGPQTLPTYFGITKTSANKELAMQVIDHLLSVENQIELARKGIIPVLTDPNVKSQFGLESKHKDKNLQTIVNQKYSTIAAKTKYDAKAKDIYIKYVGDLATGSRDLNTVFRLIEEETNNMIAQSKGQ